MKTLWLLLLGLAGCGDDSTSPTAYLSAHSAAAVVSDTWQADTHFGVQGPITAPVASPLEGQYGYGTSPPGLLVDAEGHFWLTNLISCAQYESGVFVAGEATQIQMATRTGGCTSLYDLGPDAGSLSIDMTLYENLATLTANWTYTIAEPPTPPYAHAPGSATEVWSQWRPAPPTSLVGTWPVNIPLGTDLLTPSSITIASDGSFTFQGCDWQASQEDTAVNVYTATSDCGVGLLTQYQGQLIGGVTIGTVVYNLSVIQPNLYP